MTAKAFYNVDVNREFKSVTTIKLGSDGTLSIYKKMSPLLIKCSFCVRATYFIVLPE